MNAAISLEDLLARLVERVGLAGEDELDRELRVVDQRGHQLEVAEDEVGALVGGEPPGEADRQGVEAESTRRQRSMTVLGLAPALGLPHGAVAGEGEQARLEHLVRLPELAVVDALDPLPDLGLAAPRRPTRARGGGRRAGASGGPARCGRGRRW